jgi:fructan beta-fructosidase
MFQLAPESILTKRGQIGFNGAIRTILGILAITCICVCAARAQEPDKVVADFEGTNYGSWVTTGAAFGSGPAPGTLPGQMNVDGFRGNGLVNSFYGGDDSTGTLTSPPFKVERRFLQFRIGGGGSPGKTCINLLLDGKIVRSSTGPNTVPGGSEHLAQQQWDVGELLNQRVVLQIVDQATGSWGHVNIDQIVQSDRKIPGLIGLSDVSRQIKVEGRYLNLPVKNGAPKRRVSVLLDGKAEREFDIELAPGKPDWWAFMDLTPFKGGNLGVKVDKLPEDSTGLKAIDQSDEIKDHDSLYREALRPQFHFTSRRGWLNDPNGLVFYQGEYHLFYQHNPYGWDWGNMTWGHAVSPDLIHWQELPNALFPDQHGGMFSGSAMVDWNNTAGFQTGKENVLVAMFTAAGKPFTQGLAFSNDRGRTWTKYDNNPVLPHLAAENRDPKVIWYAPEKEWVMALYLDHSDYALFSSPDLKRWEKLSDVTIPGDSECPEFFEIALDGNPQTKRWIFYGASGRYLIGTFDGKNFHPESGPLVLQQGNCWYASQTFNDVPATDGRRILIPWGRTGTGFRGMPFNQSMGIPVELTLRTTDAGPRLFANPVKELASLRTKSHSIKARTFSAEENPLANVEGELFDIVTEITPGDAAEIIFNLRGVPVAYDVKKEELSCGDRKALLKTRGGKIRLRLLVDRASIDIFGDDGAVYLPMSAAILAANRSLELYTKGGNAKIDSMEVFELKPAWE